MLVALLTIAVIVTGYNLVQSSRMKEMFGSMSEDLKSAVDALQAEVAELGSRVEVIAAPHLAKIEELQTVIAAEREAFENYRLEEDLEDLDQAAELDAAKSATDSLLAEVSAEASEINSAVAALKQIAVEPVTEPETDPETPVDEPVEEPVDEPVDEPVEDEPVVDEPVEAPVDENRNA